jgi:ribonucleoside-diphosphate reductase alpha chain
MAEQKSSISPSASSKDGLTFKRIYTEDGVHPYDKVEWEYRSAKVTNESGEIIFEQKDVEFPKSWSLNASQIVASKYFHGRPNTPQREKSLKQLIDRVALTLRDWGIKDGYFANKESGQIFAEELSHILLHQHASFNSPVWFNMATVEKPQCAACFINSVQDTMDSILELAKTEGMLFKYGSGAGTNLSVLRSKKEELSTGGYASGPVSFMKGFDAFAGSIKSGGKTRRAAKMVLLDMEHPDILEYIQSKAEEEKKAWALIDAGYDGSFTGEAYNSIFFQNANHSVRVSDQFMQLAEEGKKWHTKYVTTGEAADEYDAKELLDEVSKATHLCGDPGLQYKDTINKWHTCKNSGPINASNPCSEYVFLDDTACNLASINLLKYRDTNGEFKLEEFIHTVDILITAQEIIVGNASYPTPQIEKNSHIYRTLGLGYSNLGALLMSLGLPYDSDEGRNFAAAITSIMTGQGYLQSANIAGVKGEFEGYAKNKEPMLEVISMHRDAAYQLKPLGVDTEVHYYSKEVWDHAYEYGARFGYRNAQVTVIAPTGTISFMMDCDTTGIEPDIALIKYKKLVGGGYMTMVNQTVPLALKRLGYSKSQSKEIMDYALENGTVENAPHMKEEHLAVFDTSFQPPNGSRSIHYMGHVLMMAAAQPFLSGAISKTVNMPEQSTIEEISEVYIEGWKLGLKAIAIYRENSKRLQPLNTKDSSKKEETKVIEANDEFANYQMPTSAPVRRRMPETRSSKIHKFDVDAHEGYIIVGLYEDGAPGEVFIKMAKQGSTLGGVMDSLAVLISISLQYGVPLSVLVNKFVHTKFEPMGFTSNNDIPIVSSIVDYIFRWLALEFLPEEERPITLQGNTNKSDLDGATLVKRHDAKNDDAKIRSQVLQDTQICKYCGAIAIRSGSCYACPECGNTSGCS